MTAYDMRISAWSSDVCSSVPQLYQGQIWSKFGLAKQEVGPMKFSNQIKPISYLKANAAKVVEGLAASGEPMVITQNGESPAVIQDVRSYAQTQATIALLKILAPGNRQDDEGRNHTAQNS